MLLPLTIALTSVFTVKSYTCIPKRTVYVEGDIGIETITPIMKTFELSETPGDISVYIDSPGGSVDMGNALKTALMKARKKTNIICVVNGEADSMAFSLLEVCDKTYVTTKSSLMFHEPYMEINGTYDSKTLKKYAIEAKNTEKQMEQTISKLLGFDFKKNENLLQAYKNSYQWEPDVLLKHLHNKFYTIIDSVKCDR